MPEFPNLTRAPIIEALVFFQADASASWEPRKLRAELIALWPEHTEIQEVQSVMMEFRIGDGETPPQELKQSGVEGLIFRSKTKPTVYQVRRDGFIASWLHPYQNWDAFRDDATTQWERYALQSGISNLHSIFVRFINRVEFPIENFSPEDYFTVFPKRPSGIDWQVSNFVQQVEYAIPSTNFIVQTTLTRAFDAAPNLVAFILDTELSVTRHRELTEAGICSLGREVANQRSTPMRKFELLGRADFLAQSARRLRLDVAPDEPPRNHANILGWPTEKSAQMSLAQELAAQATFTPQT